MSVEALRKYGKHLADCQWDSDMSCTCGFDAALKAAQPERMSVKLKPHHFAAVERAISDNERHADRLARERDYSAEIPAGDAIALKEVLQVLSVEQPERVSVPREPTPEMLDAICSVRFKQGAEMYREIYKTMIAAAQEGK